MQKQYAAIRFSSLLPPPTKKKKKVLSECDLLLSGRPPMMCDMIKEQTQLWFGALHTFELPGCKNGLRGACFSQNICGIVVRSIIIIFC